MDPKLEVHGMLSATNTAVLLVPIDIIHNRVKSQVVSTTVCRPCVVLLVALSSCIWLHTLSKYLNRINLA